MLMGHNTGDLQLAIGWLLVTVVRIVRLLGRSLVFK